LNKAADQQRRNPEAAAALLIAIFPLAKAPVGFAAVLVVALLIARRASLAPTGHPIPFVRAQAGTPERNAPLSR